MFQFPGFASCIATGYPDFIGMGFPIRRSADHGLFAAPRSLSQLITSFIAFESLGIPRTLLRTSFQSCADAHLPMCSIILSTVSEVLLQNILPTCQRTTLSVIPGKRFRIGLSAMVYRTDLWYTGKILHTR